MPFITPEEVEQKKIASICHDILKEDKTTLVFNNLKIEENLRVQIEFPTTITYTLTLPNQSQETIVQKGDGFFDAMFSSLKNCLGDEYLTLKDIRVVYFKAEALIQTGDEYSSKSDSPVLIEVAIFNNRNDLLIFKSLNKSLISATVSILKNMFEFMIDIERAAVILQRDIKSGLASEKYVEAGLVKLSELLKFSSFEEIFEDRE